MKTWQQLEIIAPADKAELISDLLTELGALSISFVDAGDEPLFQIELEETPLWQQTKIFALFDINQKLQPLTTFLQSQIDQQLKIKISTIEEQNWVAQTQANFPPQCYGKKLWVIPTWCNPKDYEGTTIIIEPGLAFGTGTHPTTAMCLEWLATHPPAGKTVIDFGCGSGILALGALALGATSVYAVDHDEQAITSTRNNAALNPTLEKKIHAYRNENLPEIKAPIIIANILSGPLIDLAPNIKALATPHSTLVISGLLTDEAEKVANAYAPQFKLKQTTHKDEWALLVLQHQ